MIYILASSINVKKGQRDLPRLVFLALTQNRGLLFWGGGNETYLIPYLTVIEGGPAFEKGPPILVVWYALELQDRTPVIQRIGNLARYFHLLLDHIIIIIIIKAVLNTCTAFEMSYIW